jgi:hypothetical protein
MYEQEQHEMQIERSHPSGAEEWYCPTCGRRFLMQWPPAYSKIILQPGDEYAIHTGGKGGLSMGTPTIDTGDAMTNAPLLETIQESDGAAMEFLGESTAPNGTGEHDENAAIELSEEMLKPWRAYFEDSERGEH